MKVLIGDTIFMGPPFYVVFEPREVYPFAGQRQYSFLSYFKTWSIDLVPGIVTATFHCAIKRSTDWVNTPDVKLCVSSYIAETIDKVH